MTTCGTCQTTYGGHRTEHCMACHKTFSGTTAGDMHRTGEHGASRRCLSLAEMAEKGMRAKGNGVWGTGAEFPQTLRINA